MRICQIPTVIVENHNVNEKKVFETLKSIRIMFGFKQDYLGKSTQVKKESKELQNKQGRTVGKDSIDLRKFFKFDQSISLSGNTKVI